jgi:DNA-binding transcriptional ArsR family regulator
VSFFLEAGIFWFLILYLRLSIIGEGNMAVTKADRFDPLSIELAEFAKSLSHPARIAILRTLAEKTECICGEIVDELPLAQATVSQHLKELKAIGLIKGGIDGPRVCYCIDWERLNHLFALLEQLGKDLKTANGCC